MLISKITSKTSLCLTILILLATPLFNLSASSFTSVASTQDPNATLPPRPKSTPQPKPALPVKIKPQPQARRPKRRLPALQQKCQTHSPTRSTGNERSVDIGGGVLLNLVEIAPGSFCMGSTDYKNGMPVHHVTIGYSFYIGKYEVTQAQWRAVMGTSPAYFKGDDLPVESVSWSDAVEFCKKLSANTGWEFRLPTEAEWEYAARAGTTTKFAFGNKLSTAQANYIGNYSRDGSLRAQGARLMTTPAGSYQANGFGLYDVHGNVTEWCQDWYHGSYVGAPVDGSAWLTGGEQKHRVLRGGAWGSSDEEIGSASRSLYRPTFSTGGDSFAKYVGFRVVATARR